MYITKKIREDIFKDNGASEKDTGSTEGQIALFTTIPIKITNPNIVSISKGWKVVRFNNDKPITPPAAAGGTDNIIINGYLKLSNNMVINKYTIIIDTNKLMDIAFQCPLTY